MGLSLLDALVIQTNGENIRCGAVQEKPTGKWSGWVYLWRGGHIHRPVVNTNPVFESAEVAVSYMEALVKQVRGMDLAREV